MNLSKKKYDYGAYCEVYGKNLYNLVWEDLLIYSEGGVAVGDLARDIGISRPKAYQFIKEFLKKGYLVKGRVIGRTQMYIVNKENIIVKIYIRNFRECLKMVADEYKPKTNGRVAASVKSA
ncbi:MAG: winged helix-turn-helix domain-containing protein [Candidatus Woesearchaeota archaeon]